MRPSQLGDPVQVHYVKRFPDGTIRSSRARGEGPIEITIGVPNRRLPGLSEQLVGLVPGSTITLTVAAEDAYGKHDPNRIRRLPRDRFALDEVLVAGRLVRVQDRRGRLRPVRVVKVRGEVVVVDTNHPRCGQSVELEVELVSIRANAPEIGHWGP
jgi:peptidylprolyl isomerase